MALAENDVGLLRSLVARRSGNLLTSSQGYLIEAKLTSVAERYGLASVEALVAELKRTPLKYEDSIAEAMTINETSFFRDIQPFEALRKDIIPALLVNKSSSRQLCIWSAASSSGQEPYSIAITLREYFPQLASWNVRIVATDLCDAMVRRTSTGLYSQFEVNRGLPAGLLTKYFHMEGTQWRVHPEIRRWIDCRKMNLVSPWPTLPQFDIVFMRNVLIYFDQQSKESVLQRTDRNMDPDGYLFLGGGESLVTLNVPFVRESIGRTVCFRPVSEVTM